MKLLLVCFALLAVVSAKTYFSEDFSEGWESRWVKSGSKGEEAGLLASTEGGAKTSQDARFYQYSAAFDSFSNKGKDLVFQFTVRHAQDIDCGGGYFKLLPEGFKGESFDGETDYYVMFGPDICGSTRRTHAIITYKGENKLIKNDVPAKGDTFTHVYTFILKADQTFQILVDNQEERAGELVQEWDFLPPKEIADPDAKKPEDWVDEAKIADPEDKKPEGWDNVEAQIPDPKAEKPEDWDDDLDGEWQAPMIDNPEYKGEWKPKMIDNPAYKGPWVHPKIPNPDYYEDDEIYLFDKIAGIGLEIWQVKSGTVFGNIMITDDVQAAKEVAEKSLQVQAEEKALKEKQDEEAKKAAQEAAKKAQEEAESEKEQDDEKKEEEKDEL